MSCSHCCAHSVLPSKQVPCTHPSHTWHTPVTQLTCPCPHPPHTCVEVAVLRPAVLHAFVPLVVARLSAVLTKQKVCMTIRRQVSTTRHSIRVRFVGSATRVHHIHMTGLPHGAMRILLTAVPRGLGRQRRRCAQRPLQASSANQANMLWGAWRNKGTSRRARKPPAPAAHLRRGAWQTGARGLGTRPRPRLTPPS